MHELALSRAIVETALRHADGRPVLSVALRVGALRQVSPASLDFYFALVSAGTPCEGARLEQEAIPAVLRCRDCGEGWELERPDFRCPACGGGDCEVTSGEELEVQTIEVEEEACTEPA
jgi:hydrogenase nickel incorporation protein HypA/HybF